MMMRHREEDSEELKKLIREVAVEMNVSETLDGKMNPPRHERAREKYHILTSKLKKAVSEEEYREFMGIEKWDSPDEPTERTEVDRRQRIADRCSAISDQELLDVYALAWLMPDTSRMQGYSTNAVLEVVRKEAERRDIAEADMREKRGLFHGEEVEQIERAQEILGEW